MRLNNIQYNGTWVNTINEISLYVVRDNWSDTHKSFAHQHASLLTSNWVSYIVCVQVSYNIQHCALFNIYYKYKQIQIRIYLDDICLHHLLPHPSIYNTYIYHLSSIPFVVPFDHCSALQTANCTVHCSDLIVYIGILNLCVYKLHYATYGICYTRIWYIVCTITKTIENPRLPIGI